MYAFPAAKPEIKDFSGHKVMAACRMVKMLSKCRYPLIFLIHLVPCIFCIIGAHVYTYTEVQNICEVSDEGLCEKIDEYSITDVSGLHLNLSLQNTDTLLNTTIFVYKIYISIKYGTRKLMYICYLSLMFNINILI